MAVLLSPAWIGAATVDLFSDTWVVTDALGRKAPTYPEAPAPRPNRTVGLFYFLWHGAHIQGGPFDVTKILAADPEAMQKPDSPLWGPLHAPHHWGESIFGYYLTRDEAVLRKHAQMLSDAGVDVVIFDVTNQITYRDDYMTLLRVWAHEREIGNPTPQAAFLTPFWAPAKVTHELWRDLYSQGLYRDMWFQWNGKPLILADATLLSESQEQSNEEAKRIRDFFTFRKPQPDYFRGPTQTNMWSWLEVFPQHRFTNSAGVNEQMSVGVAQNAVNRRLGSMSESGAHGRSFHNGASDQRPDAVRFGFNAQEQWERTLRDDPLFVFVTGWNEWIAGRFAEFNRVKLPVMFVDQFDQEHSRDIEPMRGGHGDDYYWQLIRYVRRYKGARPLPKVISKPITIDGAFEDWRDVQPEFRDTVGDPVQREHRGWDAKMTYRNHTGRNDFVAAKVNWDEERVYFYARTLEPITSPAGTNWMTLLIDLDADAVTGWLGYDFAVNYAGAGSLARHVAKGNGFDWKVVADSGVQVKWQGRELEVSIPWRAIEQSHPTTLDFKWADNCFEKADWTDFTLNGDAAPNDRFNYRAVLR